MNVSSVNGMRSVSLSDLSTYLSSIDTVPQTAKLPVVNFNQFPKIITEA